MWSTEMVGFRKSTVFVIGAGAHVDYSMPTGQQIVDGLCAWADGKASPEWNSAIDLVAPPAWDNAGPTIDFPDGGKARRALEKRRLNELAHKLGGSSHESIDSLLEHWSDYEDLGRRALSAILLVHESKALQAVRIGGLYRWLAGRCASRVTTTGGGGQAIVQRTQSGGFDRLSLVTFNYDRLAEYHLDKLLENHTAQRPRDKRPRVMHMYGQLTCEARNEATRFATKFGQETVRQCAQSIRIATSRMMTEKDEDLDSARISIANASQIVFLGFAFDTTNLRRLGFPDLLHGTGNVRIFATGYGMNTRRRASVVELIGRDITWGGDREGCIDCLDRWDSELE